ncbi:ral GTPase-activating protein subunit alpha-1-like isoform X3 [Varroa jacobsoni]|uniref:ral GTPase-activating protein subunit alpha-1-like isoform X3 n=1 Tax=Varroa jacobsoni TaxID=62625 RepID=UPI000BF78D80|nr:ral GTPase-activating protein subunit alpha-1-like isoform X3 [Varroa jacobsoni]
MFKRDRNIDIVKKAQAKVIEPKRDSFNRLKHLKTFLEHVENQEAKDFFTANYSVLFFIFHDAFSIVEANIRSKGVHKSQREEFEQVRFLFEKILTLLPELLAEGWQAHSIRIAMKKLLHHGNSFKTLCEGIRLFILWYQALKENAPIEVDQMFGQLVPGIVPPSTVSIGPQSPQRDEAKSQESPPNPNTNKDHTFYTVIENEIGPVVAGDQGWLFPPVAGDIQPEDLQSALLEFLLQAVVAQVTKIQWAKLVVNGVRQYERCFSFLLERFRAVYVPHLFPHMSTKYSLYTPNLDLPAAVRSDSVLLSRVQSVVLQWLVSYVSPLRDEREAGATRNAQRMESSLTFYAAKLAWNSFVDDDMQRIVPVLPETDFLTVVQRAVVRNVLFSSPANVDFVHELFRQCLVSPLGQTQTTKKVIAVYREWIQLTHPDPPWFLVEQPSADQPRNPVYCGQQNLYKVFITNASNFFLLSLPAAEGQLLAEQVDLCKRVMNIYRFMVMKKLMERATWEQLLYVILHVTSEVLTHDSPRKDTASAGSSGAAGPVNTAGVGATSSSTTESLGQQLSAALFQTLIVTWIKANLHATICVDLWNGFVRVLSTLAHWEPLVDEWAKTMKTLTRILTTRVYNLDLDNLPLDRLSEQQSKRRRALGKGGKSQDGEGRRGPGSGAAETASGTVRTHRIANDVEGSSKLIQGKSSLAEFLGGVGSSGSGSGHSPASLQRSLSDSHILMHRRNDMNLAQGGRLGRVRSQRLLASPGSGSFSGGCHLQQDSASASPAASSSALESSSIKDHQQLINHVMDCASSDNAGGQTSSHTPLIAGQDMFVRRGSTASEYGSHRASVSSRFDIVRCDSAGEQALREQQQQHLLHQQSFSHIPPLTFDDTGMTTSSTNRNATGGGDVNVVGNALLSNSCSGASANGKGESSASAGAPRNGPAASAGGAAADPQKTDVGKKESGDAMEDGDEEYFGECGDPDGRSVLAGGSQKGWCPEVAAVLWRRMLCSLGNINQIADPHIQCKIMEQLAELSETLLKVRENQGVCEDGSVTSTAPMFIPPVHILTPWLFEATMLGDEYERGRLVAYTLLCDLSLRSHDVPLSAEYVTRLYDVLHRGLTGSSPLVRQCLVRAAGTRFFGARLPGFSLLAWDFTRAAGGILEQHTLKGIPRSEAVQCLGSQLFLGQLYGQLQALNPAESESHQLLPLTGLEEEVISRLMAAASGDPDWQARCTALCAVSVWCYQQLLECSYHVKLLPALTVLLQSLQPGSASSFHQKGVKFSKCNQYTVCQTAAECLALLAEFAPVLLRDLPVLLDLVVKILSVVLIQLYPSANVHQEINERFACLVTSLMFCLAEWIMAIPLDELTRSDGLAPTSLQCALTALDGVVKGTRSDGSVWSGGQIPTLAELFEKLKPKRSDNSSGSGGHKTGTSSVGHHIQSPPETPGGLKPRPPLNTSFSDPARNATLVSSDGRTQSGDGNTNKANPHTNIKLAAKAILCHLLNNVGHFPMNSVSLSSLSSLTTENDDVASCLTRSGSGGASTMNSSRVENQGELSRSAFTAPNIQFFTLNDTAIVSLVEIPPNDKSSDVTEGKARTRVIVRDLCGKFSWECVTLYGPLGCRVGSFPPGPSPDPCMYYAGTRTKNYQQQQLYAAEQLRICGQRLSAGAITGGNESSPQHGALVQSTDADLGIDEKTSVPTWPINLSDSNNSNGSGRLVIQARDNGAHQWNNIKDNLDKVIGYIGVSSPECALQQPLNTAPKALGQQSSLAEADQINEVLSYAEAEQAEVAALRWSPRQRSVPLMPPGDLHDSSEGPAGSSPPHHQDHSNGLSHPHGAAAGGGSAIGQPHTSLAPFQYSRLLLDQLNFLSWERRSSIALLQKNDKLLRELRYLDQQRSRETHKIAVIYVQAGQEDKNSILMNQCGSPEFEAFVSGLGWDVDLRSHSGYRGGLDAHGSTGLTAPYYADSFVEVLYHVSTRIPAHEKDAMTKKLRHLGNDEVHVVWSEHAREYRRGIIATEFGDVFIVLYPLPDGLCRVQINAKHDVPFFGPLFDGSIVDQRVLPALVRATAINADRAVNSLKLMFRRHTSNESISLTLL